VIEIPRAWQHSSQPETVQFMITANADQRHIHLKKSENRALYDFIVAHITQRDAIPDGCRDPLKMSSGPPGCHPGCHLCSYLSSAAWCCRA
jgi:hypothetical protein